MLEKLPKPVMSLAHLPENKGKCRYKGLYPSDKHRVILNRTGASDYINASYIEGYKMEKMYIAAQGPTLTTVDDFWFMIWQERPSVIVMVTKVVESRKTKCEQYWPLDVGDELLFGGIHVELSSSESWSDFSVAHLKVTKNGESRNLLHFNYLSWPDHGVPDNIGSFVAFYRRIQAETVHMTQPALVHCSAGVGRTGTYIALEYLSDQAGEERVVDMFECVKKMRSRRPCMIQTVDQYVFLHHVLFESIATKRFFCMPLELESKLDIHCTNCGSEYDVISAEYQHIENRVNSLTLPYTTAILEENLAKSRFSEILPCEKYLPYLLDGAQGNFINAVLVDGYRKKNGWIATQLPLSNTIGDFWQLMIEQDVKIVVQLEGTQTPFFPVRNLKSISIQEHIISRESSADTDHTKTVHLQIKTEKKTLPLAILVVKYWSKSSAGQPSPALIVTLQEALEKLQQKMGDGNICVTCIDGSTRCGLLICACNALEKLKVEQEVDLFNPTIMARLRRPQFVPTMGQYRLLYEVIKEYADSFSEYANFR